jgi:hypothetical protein
MMTQNPFWIETTMTFSGIVTGLSGSNDSICVYDEHLAAERIIAVAESIMPALMLGHRYFFDVAAEQDFRDLSKICNFKYCSHFVLLQQAMSVEELIAAESAKWDDMETLWAVD